MKKYKAKETGVLSCAGKCGKVFGSDGKPEFVATCALCQTHYCFECAQKHDAVHFPNAKRKA